MKISENPGFNRDDAGPGRRTGIDVRKVGGNEKFRVVVASREIAGYWTHWDPVQKQTVPCLNGKQLCPFHLKGFPGRWCAWLHVVSTSGNAGVWLELTACARDNLLDVLPEGFILRGTKLLVQRQKKTEKSPLVFDYLGLCEDGFELVQPADPENILRRLYRKQQFPGLDGVHQVD